MQSDRIEYTTTMSIRDYDDKTFLADFYTSVLGRALRLAKYEVKSSRFDDDGEEVKITIAFVKLDELEREKRLIKSTPKMVAEYYIAVRQGIAPPLALIQIARKYDCTVKEVGIIFENCRANHIVNNIQDVVVHKKMARHKKNYPAVIDANN